MPGTQQDQQALPALDIGVFSTDPTCYDQPPRSGARHLTNIIVARVKGYRPLMMDLHLPASPPGGGPVPLIAWIHGGSFWEGSRTGLPDTLHPIGFQEHLLARGYAVADIDYRLSREAVFPAQLHDVQAAIGWLRTFAEPLGLDPRRFAGWGESAGATLAALAGLDRSHDLAALQAVVDWYGPIDVTAPGMGGSDEPGGWLLGGSPAQKPALAEAAEAASPIRQVHAAAPPFVLVHGTADDAVPYQGSRTLADALHGYGVRAELIPVDGAGHMFAGASDILGLIHRSLDFLDVALKK
ncbi:prolyl oligopeptidase family serine peptidase [Streptosporangium subroseum]|uniref:prolyl oligopeptidase family serine peptidase n=1 Tax=Streptosporangium subroseum TaxID=106412 RepID=UPI00309057E1|nr:alpha/beta hydrolase [Streptosporangium subroseum]